jgi:heavy-metal-associated domain-containing protein
MVDEAHVSHHIPGRMRVKLPRAKGQHRVLQDIRQLIAPMPGVQRVEINPATGSVLVYYEPERHEEFHTQLTEHAMQADLFALKPPELSEVDEVAEKIEAEAEFLAAHSDIAQRMIDVVKQIDTGIKRATNNNVDLKVLLPLGLAIYALVEAGTEAVTPLWVTLGIFSFNSFVALHRAHPAAQGETASIHDGPEPVA